MSLDSLTYKSDSSFRQLCTVLDWHFKVSCWAFFTKEGKQLLIDKGRKQDDIIVKYRDPNANNPFMKIVLSVYLLKDIIFHRFVGTKGINKGYELSFFQLLDFHYQQIFCFVKSKNMKIRGKLQLIYVGLGRSNEFWSCYLFLWFWILKAQVILWNLEIMDLS